MGKDIKKLISDYVLNVSLLNLRGGPEKDGKLFEKVTGIEDEIFKEFGIGSNEEYQQLLWSLMIDDELESNIDKVIKLLKKKAKKTEIEQLIFEITHKSDWDYCWENKLPQIIISDVGTKYAKISFDVLPLTRYERYRVLSFSDHVIPLYKLYKKYYNLPDNKFSFAGGGNCGVMTVFKKDMIEIATKLHDLLLEIGKRDEEVFNMDPFEVDKQGNNAEGWNEINFPQYLKKLKDDELMLQYKGKIYNNYLKYRPKERALYENEMTRRNLLNMRGIKNKDI